MMGGQQLFQDAAKLSEKLFRDHGDVYGRKTADDKITELRDSCFRFCKHTEDVEEILSKQFEKIHEEIRLLKSDVDFLKSQITNGSNGKWGAYATKEEMQGTFDMYRQMQILLKQEFDKLGVKVEHVLNGCTVAKPAVAIEQPKIAEPVKDDLEGWLKISDLITHVKKLKDAGKVKINDDYLIIGGINNLYKHIGLVKLYGNSSVTATDFGIDTGYVKKIRDSSNTYPTYYNVDKCVKLCEKCSNPGGFLKTLDEFEKMYSRTVGEALA